MVVKRGSLILMEEHRLRVFENRILRQVFGHRRDAKLRWRRLHNEELRIFYLSLNTVRVIKSTRLKWAYHVARTEEGRRTFKILKQVHSQERYL